MASVVAPMPTSGGTSAISSANHTIWAAAVVAGDEELRVLSEQVEQRLGHRQTAQTQDDERPCAHLCCHHVGHRAASYRRPGSRGRHHHPWRFVQRSNTPLMAAIPSRTTTRCVEWVESLTMTFIP